MKSSVHWSTLQACTEFQLPQDLNLWLCDQSEALYLVSQTLLHTKEWEREKRDRKAGEERKKGGWKKKWMTVETRNTNMPPSQPETLSQPYNPERDREKKWMTM